MWNSEDAFAHTRIYVGTLGPRKTSAVYQKARMYDSFDRMYDSFDRPWALLIVGKSRLQRSFEQSIKKLYSYQLSKEPMVYQKSHTFYQKSPIVYQQSQMFY